MEGVLFPCSYHYACVFSSVFVVAPVPTMMMAFWFLPSLGKGLAGIFPSKKRKKQNKQGNVFQHRQFSSTFAPPISNTLKLGCGGAKARPEALLTGHSRKGGHNQGWSDPCSPLGPLGKEESPSR